MGHARFFLGRKLDKRFYAVKGGCNLRFFLHSFRYSEDMDMDVRGIPQERLRSTVEGILQSKPLDRILSVKGLHVQTWTAPKQTATTQARDVFDLGLLLAAGANARIAHRALIAKLGEAQAAAMSITFRIFKAQVLFYLHPDYRDQYDSASVWEDWVLRVVEGLEGGK